MIGLIGNILTLVVISERSFLDQHPIWLGIYALIFGDSLGLTSQIPFVEVIARFHGEVFEKTSDNEITIKPGNIMLATHGDPITFQ